MKDWSHVHSHWRVGMHVECNVYGKGWVLCELIRIGGTCYQSAHSLDHDTFSLRILEGPMKDYEFHHELMSRLVTCLAGTDIWYRCAAPRNKPTTQFGDDT